MTKDRWYSPRLERKTVRCYVAGVAELADALDSKSSDRKIVWVRAPPPALPLELCFVNARRTDVQGREEA